MSIFNFFQSETRIVFMNSVGKVISVAMHKCVDGFKICKRSSINLLFLYGVSMNSCDWFLS